MKKLLVVLLMIIFAASIKAEANDVVECKQRLLNNFRADRSSYVIDLDDIQMRDYGTDILAKSIRVVRELLDDIGCSPKAINFGWGPQGRIHNSCKYFDNNRRDIQVCLVQSNLGYFIIHEDYLNHATVNFYRWD
ncbi:MAG: hypothetical protein EP319_08430 [Deltaproteobacteria bacterium]|nr:MAG: hypothetical protein EP319_08430 [Deltaproteobacteria bacterium]